MACRLQVDNALTAAQSVLFPKGLDTAVATSRQQHAANVEAANEAREAYLTKASLSSFVICWQRFSSMIACIFRDSRGAGRRLYCLTALAAEGGAECSAARRGSGMTLR